MPKKEKIDFRDKLKEIGKEKFGLEIKDNIESNENKNEDTDYCFDHIENIKENNRKATAPYNFIPINKKVVSSEFSREMFSFDEYHKDKNTGYIEVNICTKTPMYIRGNKSEGDDDNSINPEFFRPAKGYYRIPGSSLRGMLRNLVEIVSFGKFVNFEEKRLYMRGMADQSNLRYDYQETMIDKKNNYFPKVKSGWIRKTGFKKYLIYPSITDSFNNQFYRINFDKRSLEIQESGNPPISLNQNEFEEIFFKPVSVENHDHKRYDKKKNKEITYKLKYALVKGIRRVSDNYYNTKGYVINTGTMNNKHMHWIINEPDFTKGIDIDYNVIKEYSEDKNRESLDILKEIDKKKNGIPCFYITDESDKISGFGFTAMFRLPYKNTIGDHIPNSLKENNNLDISESIFGNESEFSGRVFVEDSFCSDTENPKIELGENYPQNLSGPKPTTFQHYLTQESEDVKELKNYNPDLSGKLSAIRGNKIYWHKENENWIASEEDVNNYPNQYTSRINPLRKDTLFNGRIRFENLSDVELGALLFALVLPEGCLHKLGMGKPLGLGSVEITSRLHLSDRQRRYTELFEEWTESIEESKKDGKEINDFKDKFADYVLKQLNGKDKKYKSEDLWKDERMQELKKMLNWNDKPSNDKVKYMTLQKFKNRPVLPKPSDV